MVGDREQRKGNDIFITDLSIIWNLQKSLTTHSVLNMNFYLLNEI